MSAGKGDDYRKVDKAKFDRNYEAIFGKKENLDQKKDKKDLEKENNANVA